MSAALRRIVPSAPVADTWAPFGWLPVSDTDPRDGDRTLEFAWADPHVNRIAHRRDEVPATPDGLRCELLFRHAGHTQVLMPLGTAAVVVVGPPGAEFAGPADAGVLRAFLLAPLTAVVLDPGTWHWGPFPVAAVSVELLNVQGRRYLEDNERVDLVAVGAAVEVARAG